MEKDGEMEGFGGEGQRGSRFFAQLQGRYFSYKPNGQHQSPPWAESSCRVRKAPYTFPYTCKIPCRILVRSKAFPAHTAFARQPLVRRNLAALHLAEPAEHSQTAAAKEALHLEVSEFARLIARKCSLQAPVNC